MIMAPYLPRSLSGCVSRGRTSDSCDESKQVASFTQCVSNSGLPGRPELPSTWRCNQEQEGASCPVARPKIRRREFPLVSHHVELPDAAIDELAILGTSIQDGHLLGPF